jgi:hypothetical protein
MFVDRIKVFAQAGNGGRGSVSFRFGVILIPPLREKDLSEAH